MAGQNALFRTTQSGVCKQSDGPNPQLAATTVLTDIANSAATLTISKSHNCVSGVVSAMTESCFQIVQDDNGTETIIATLQVGPGQYTKCFKFGNWRHISRMLSWPTILLST